MTARKVDLDTRLPFALRGGCGIVHSRMTRSTATGSRRKSPARERRRDGGLPANLAKLLRRALPEGLVELQGPADESWLSEVEAKVRSKLAGLPGAGLAFERSPNPQRPHMDDPEQPADVDESSRSYHLFFIAPAAPWARLNVEDERPVDFEEGLGKHGEEAWERVKGSQQVGCAVAVSVLAPVGFVRLDALTTYEDGACEEPDIQPKIFDLDFKPMDPHEYWAELYEGEELSVLLDFERKATDALTSLGIRVLSADEAATVVPFLRVGEAFVNTPVRLQDAFFFEAP